MTICILMYRVSAVLCDQNLTQSWNRNRIEERSSMLCWYLQVNFEPVLLRHRGQWHFQSWEWKCWNNVLFLFKVSNKYTRTTFSWRCSNIFLARLEYSQYNSIERWSKTKAFSQCLRWKLRFMEIISVRFKMTFFLQQASRTNFGDVNFHILTLVLFFALCDFNPVKVTILD